MASSMLVATCYSVWPSMLVAMRLCVIVACESIVDIGDECIPQAALLVVISVYHLPR